MNDRCTLNLNKNLFAHFTFEASFGNLFIEAVA